MIADAIRTFFYNMALIVIIKTFQTFETPFANIMPVVSEGGATITFCVNYWIKLPKDSSPGS